MHIYKTFMIILFLLIAPSVLFAQAAEQEHAFQGEGVVIHLFEQRGCPDCGRAKQFLEDVIKQEYPLVQIQEYSILQSENQDLFRDMMKQQGIEEYRIMVPVLFIGNNTFQDFLDADKTLIKRAIEGENVQQEIDISRGERVVTIPFIGRLNISDWSLIGAAILIGSLDGLNVCSIGALILILMIVLGFKSRFKVILYGSLFILTTVIIYGLLVFAWSALFDMLASYIGPINIFIALAALLGGIYFSYKFLIFCKYGPACEFSDNKYIIKATKNLKQAFANEKSQMLFLSMSVISFATIITLVELPCSFGLPMIYGGMLAAADLSIGTHFLYILLYLLFYMLIEIIIFAGAVITKEIWFAESRIITWIYGAGALVLFFLSYYYFFGI